MAGRNLASDCLLHIRLPALQLLHPPTLSQIRIYKLIDWEDVTNGDSSFCLLNSCAERNSIKGSVFLSVGLCLVCPSVLDYFIVDFHK